MVLCWNPLQHSGKSTTIRDSNHGSCVCKEYYVQYYVQKSSILLDGTGGWKISSVACGFKSIIMIIGKV